MGIITAVTIGVFARNHLIEALALFVSAIIVARLAEWGLRVGASRLGHLAHAELGEEIFVMTARPVFVSIILAGAGLTILLIPPPGKIGFAASATVKSLMILVWLVFMIRASRLFLTWMTGKQNRFSAIQPVTLPLFEIATKLALVLGALYLVLITWGFDVTGWLASAGIVGIAVGFAAKDTLSNLFAGVSIIADRPYRIGDYIRLSDADRGRVSMIGLRSTRIVTHDYVEITVPNSVIANSKITNESRPAGPSRMHLPVGVPYGSDLDQVRKALVQAAESVSEVSRDPGPQARVVEFNDSLVRFELLCWVPNPIMRGKVRDAVNTAIYNNLIQTNSLVAK